MSRDELIAKIEERGLNIFDIIAPPPLTKIVEPFNPKNADLPGEIVKSRDSTQLIKAYFEFRGIADDIISGYDNWIQSLPEQVRSRPITLPDDSFVKVVGVRFEKPTFSFKGVVRKLYPQQCREERLIYEARMYIVLRRFKYVKNDNEYVSKPLGPPSEEILAARFPAMLGSVLCHLRGLSDEEKLKVGECPNDPLGYFIVKAEYYIVIHETLRKWRVFTYINKNKSLVTRTTFKSLRSTAIIDILHQKGIIVVDYTSFPDRTNPVEKEDKTHMDFKPTVFQMLRLMGKTIGLELSRDDLFSYVDVFIPDRLLVKVRYELEPTMLLTLSIGDDMNYILEHYADNIVGGTPEAKKERFLESLQIDLFPHMITMPMKPRMYMLGYMTAQMAMQIAGVKEMDGRDDWGNKSFNGAGPAMNKLFNAVWYRMTSNIIQVMKTASKGSLRVEVVASKINPNTIGDEYSSSFSEKRWGLKNSHNHEEGITELLKRDTTLNVISSTRQVTVKTSSKTTSGPIRGVQPTQYGYCGPFDTPESERIGIKKNLSIGAFLSLDRNESLLYNLLTDRVSPDRETLKLGWVTPCLLNGKFMGWCDGDGLRRHIISARRKGMIDFDISVVMDSSNDTLVISSDEGRAVRPLLVVNEETGELVIDEKKMWDASFRDLLENGAVEFIDAYEQRQPTMLLAQDLDTFDNRFDNINQLTGRLEELSGFLDKLEKGEGISVNPESSDVEPSRVTPIDNDSRKRELEAEMKVIVAQEAELAGMDIDYSDRTRRNNRVTRSAELRQRKIEIKKELNRIRREGEALEREAAKNRDNYKGRLISEGREALINETKKEISLIESFLERAQHKTRYTHCEIDPVLTLSYSVGLIPYPHTTYGPRITYQASMAKQAVGISHSNDVQRFDTGSRRLAYPSAPITRSVMTDILNLDKTPSGSMVMIAWAMMEGHNQEDSIVMNEAAIERGLFAGYHFPTFKAKLVKGDDFRETFEFPPEIKPRQAHMFEHIGENGIARLGSYISKGQVVINRVRRWYRTGVVENISEIVSESSEGYVIRVMRPDKSDPGEYAKVKLRQKNKPVVGWKFAISPSQKTTVSKILPEEQMPYVEGMYGDDGKPVRPDIIINPLGIPSRMTVGILMEMIQSMAGILEGRTVDATAFRKIDMEKAMQVLEDHGYDRYGRVWMVNPATGKRMDGKISFGPIYEQQLRHYPELKIQARSTGSHKLGTHQPTRGQTYNKTGGLRVGEYEKDAAASHGASEIIRERLCKSSDEFISPVCVTCGKDAEMELESQSLKCTPCGDKARFGKYSRPFLSDTLRRLLFIVGTNMVREFKRPTELSSDEEDGERSEEDPSSNEEESDYEE